MLLLTSCSKKNSNNTLDKIQQNNILDDNLQKNTLDKYLQENTLERNPQNKDLEENLQNKNLEENPQYSTLDKNPQYSTIDELLQYNSLEDAKKDGIVIFEESEITSGQDVFDEFINKCDKKEEASILLAKYYTMEDASKSSNEASDSKKDQKTVLFIYSLVYDGTEYTIKWNEDNQLFTKTYTYLIKYQGKPRSSTATFSEYIRYVLVNDDSVTWEDIEDGMLSSKSDASIDHYNVYTKYIK